MVARSALVDVRPFRTGLAVSAFGLMLTLGANGGWVGRELDRLFSALLGATGATIVGVTTLVVGLLLLTGASLGAFLRRSGHAVRRAHGHARRLASRPEPVAVAAPLPRRCSHAVEPPVDVEHDYPDVVSETGPPPLLAYEPEHPLVRSRRPTRRASSTRCPAIPTTTSRTGTC